MAGHNSHHSPFQVFRKNQKVWLAVLGVGTMISFIILPAVLQLFSGSSGQGPQALATTRHFGTIDQRTVSVLLQERDQLHGFYRRLYELLAPTLKEEDEAKLQGLASVIGQLESKVGTEAVIYDWLLVQCAKEQGVAADRPTIVEYLKKLTGGLLTDTLFRNVLKDTGLPEQRLEYLVSQELLKQQIYQSFIISQSVVSPATRWNWFQRLNRNMTAEIAAVPVDSFFTKAAEPTEADLKKLFDDNKDKNYNPLDSDSGFIIPTKLAFQYVQAKPSKKMLDSITQDEIKKYYEEHKDADYRKPVKPIERPTLPTLPGMGSVPFTPKPATPTAPEETPATPPQEEKKTEPATPDTVKPEAPKSEEPKPEEKPAEKKEEGKTAAFVKGVQTRLVAYQTDKPVETPAAPTTETKTETPKKEDEITTTPVSKLDGDKKPETPVDLSILYKPLPEVEGEIRQILALQKAQNGLQPIEEKMREHFQAYNTNFDKGLPIPAMPDLTKFAEEQGLTLVSVPLGTIFDAIKTELSRKASDRSFLIKAFREGPVEFEPLKTQDGETLLWITEIVKELKPESVDEVKDIAVKQWKEKTAQPLALEQANLLLAEAKKSGKSLAETFKDKDVKVAETEPFAWKSYGPGIHPFIGLMQRLPLGIGEVCEKGVAEGNSDIDNKIVFAPGNDFMKVASSLAVGEAGVAFNAPKTVAYVIRITGSTPSDDVLWEQFPTTNPGFYYQAGIQEQQAEAFDAWIKKIQESTGFKWLKKPETLDRQN